MTCVFTVRLLIYGYVMEDNNKNRVDLLQSALEKLFKSYKGKVKLRPTSIPYTGNIY